VSVEAMDMGGGRETVGLAGDHGKHDWWDGAFITPGLTVEGPFLHGDDRFAVIFGMDTVDKATGEADAGPRGGGLPREGRQDRAGRVLTTFPAAAGGFRDRR
jgi:hypothetical protein